jgi:hypothetical protein
MVDLHTPDSEGFIPGVFNYCDRRCERCRFVRQCRVGTLEVDEVADGEVADERPEDLKAKLLKLMGLTEEEIMAFEEEVERQAEVEEDDEEEQQQLRDHQEEQEMIRERVEAHALTNMCRTYLELVDEWLEPRETMFRGMGVSLQDRMDVAIAASLRTAEKLVLSEALEEVRWLRTMLVSKCHRALHGLFDGVDEFTTPDGQPYQSDHNGTAKLALEIVSRCEAAWELVARHLPQEAGELVPIQEVLRRIHQSLHSTFPDAERFIRPGFDAPLHPEG